MNFRASLTRTSPVRSFMATTVGSFKTMPRPRTKTSVFADPRSIAIGFEGAEKLSLDPDGSLVLVIKDREIQFQKPIVYQEADGVRTEVEGALKA